MRRIILVGALLLTGCQNVIGPFRHRQPQRVDDPCISTNEQERRGRDRLALPENSPALEPGARQGLPEPPGPSGR